MQGIAGGLAKTRLQARAQAILRGLDRVLLGRVLACFRPYRWLASLSAVAIIVTAVLGLAPPLLVKGLIDSGKSNMTYRDRVEEELSVIKAAGMADYMLMVAEGVSVTESCAKSAIASATPCIEPSTVMSLPMPAFARQPSVIVPSTFSAPRPVK